MRGTLMRCVLTRLQAWKRNPIRKRNGALRLSWRSARPQVPDFLQQFSDMHLAADLRCASGSWSKGSVGLLPWKHAGETLNNTKPRSAQMADKNSNIHNHATACHSTR